MTHHFQPVHRNRDARRTSIVRSHRRHVTRHRRGEKSPSTPFVPPEDWHEPVDAADDGFSVVVQPPGEGYVHAVDESLVRQRLDLLPEALVQPLQVVQLSRMTRKKKTFPCYGMQWGTAVYLYPIEESLVEHFGRPPQPAVYNETRMFGGRWLQQGSRWELRWTLPSLRDYYLNNVLIHELGHLLDDRNTGYIDRERYAEWFAIHYGYRPSRPSLRGQASGTRHRRVARRHHARHVG